MKSLFVAALIATAAPGIVAAAEVWKLDANVNNFQYEETCTLQIGGGKIEGECASNDAPAPVKALGTYTVSGGVTHSEFAYDVKVNDQPMHVVYRGESQADGTIKGAVDASGAVGAFTAVRQK